MPFATKALRDRNRRRIARDVQAGRGCCFCQRPMTSACVGPTPGVLLSTTPSRQAAAAATTTTSCAPHTTTATGSEATNPTAPSDATPAP